MVIDTSAIVAILTGEREAAMRAYRQFGKGNHPSGLSFGDCFSYALSKSLDQPLFFKGHDFRATDVTVAS